MKRTVAMIAVLVLCGCHAGNQRKLHAKADAYVSQEILDLRNSDADRIAAERINSGNWQFLVLSGGMMEPTSLPGLSEEEIREYVISGRCKWEIYRFDDSYRGLVSPALEQDLSAARIAYATRLNRALVKCIKAKDLARGR